MSRYLSQLLAALGPAGKEHEFTVYWEGGASSSVRGLGARFSHRRLSLKDGRSSLERLQRDLPRLLRRDRIDVFHTEFDNFPLAAPCATVVSIHDAGPVLAPRGMVPRAWQRAASQQMLLAARLADGVIVPSRHVAGQLTGLLDVPAGRISQVYYGCPSGFGPMPREQAAAAVRKRFGLRRPYVLSVGILNRRKNYPLLIRAFRERLWEDHDLVIVGKRGWSAGEVLRMIAGSRHIRYLGPVPDRDLNRLYAAASCLAFPSRDEGFGFPPLEAMACGVPVVASRCSSLPEVVGDAGLLVTPGSARELARAMERVLEDAGLRESLRRRGFKRVRAFRWERTARGVLAAYRRALRLRRARTSG